MILTSVVHLIDTLAYSVRLNSVRSGQFALSTSLFNIFVMVSRTANTLQGPLIGSVIGASIAAGLDPLPGIRRVVLSATAGTLVGILLVPTFLKIFAKAVARLELTGSIPAIVVQALSISNIKRIARTATTPSRRMLNRLSFQEIPKTLLALYTFIAGIYTIGVLAAFYSATLVAPEHRLAASASSGMINGIATVLLTLFVDPKFAIITDQTLKGERPYTDVKALVILLIGAKLIGTLLGQAFLVPAAQLIASVYG